MEGLFKGKESVNKDRKQEENKKFIIYKKDIITFVIIFIIACITLIGFFPMHYATDTYNIINIGYEEYMMNNSLKDGRIIMGILVFIANLFNMPIEIWIPILLVLAVIISCISVIILKNIILSYKPAKNKWVEIIVLLISYCTIFNFMYLENLYFAECAVMALSILAYMLSARNVVKKNYAKAIFWAILGVVSYQGNIGVIAVMTVLFTFLENTGNKKFVQNIILDIIKTVVIMLLAAVTNFIVIKIICTLTGMTGDRTQSMSGIINNLKYIYYNYTRVIENTGGMLKSGEFIVLLSIVSMSAIILFISKSKEPAENLLELIWIIVVAIAVSFISSAMSLSGFNSARIRFTIGMLIGVIFIFMYCKSKLFEKTQVFEIIFSFLVISYVLINMYTYFSITVQHKNTNEFEKIEANMIENAIEKYEKENSIAVQKICIIKKSEGNHKLETSKNSCVPTYIATRCEWGITGALQYYEGRELIKTDGKYLENQEFTLSGKQYKCIGDTLYINVSVY